MKNHAEKCQYTHNKYSENGEIIAYCKCMSRHECDCDGYHTFAELYEHRIVLWIALCRVNTAWFYEEERGRLAWRSKRHSDGELAFGGEWFILGIGKEKGEQITYHLPIARWDETDFAETLEQAPEWDGHTSDDVLERLKNL